ncbi:MAG: MFS transporter [Alphaproteobacteria bacterium]|nr:MFS transporter [Alphaproteobacteria bacterium]
MTLRTPAESVARGATDWTRLGFGLGLAVLATFHLFKLPPVLPMLRDAYGYAPWLAGAFMSVYAVVGVLLSVPLGRAMERGHLWSLLWMALALLTAASVIVPLQPQLGYVVLAARGAEGVAFAVLAIAGPALMTASVSPRDATVAAGLFATWIPIGQAGASLIAQPFLAANLWHPLWWLAAVITLCAAAACWWLRRARPGTGRAGQAAAASGGAAPRSPTALYLGAVIFTLWSAQYFAASTWLNAFLIDRHGLSLAQANAGYLISVVLVGLCAFTFGWVLRAGVPLTTALALALFGQGAMWCVLPLVTGAVAGLTALGLWGLCAGATATCLFSLPSRILGPRAAGTRAFAVLMVGRNLGVMLGPIVLAELSVADGAWHRAAVVFGAVTLVAAGIAALPALRRGAAAQLGD